jgi:predicted DNA-binding ribbon-helix-helix protein
MEAYTLFNQNFAVAESLLQLHQLFHGLEKSSMKDELRLAICQHWGAPENAVVQHACNDRVSVLARAATRIPDSLVLEGGLDFLLRQAVVVACTSLEAFFWDALRENVLTIVKARRTGTDKALLDLTFSLRDYISIQEYEDPDLRLKQIILKNFERGTLYGEDKIGEIMAVMTVHNFWKEVEAIAGQPAASLRTQIQELIQRRNQIAHRADRPDRDGEEVDGHGLRPIGFPWTNVRVQAARTLVSSANELVGQAMEQLNLQIQAAREQELARRAAKAASTGGSS